MPKVGVVKKVYLDEQGHYRFYSATYNSKIHNKKNKPRMPVIDLNLLPNIKTEKQLCRYIYDTFGPGEYRLIGYAKKRRGFWTFWRGEINDEGFSFITRETEDMKEIRRLKDELKDAEDEEERQFIRDMLDATRDLKVNTKYGFVPYLKKAARRGSFVFWKDDDIEDKQEEQTEDWAEATNEVEQKTNKREEDDDWGVEYNKKEEKEDAFEEW